ncbi:MAG: universal stress protein, partial [Elusimicrobia bacterium]|nr:universal stress protein [Elusimicrobiota bacterium]
APVVWTGYADRGLLAARAWAAAFKAALGVLHVYEPGEEELPARAALQGHVRDMLGGVEPEWLWRVGTLADEVVEAARDGGYDLVVLAGHAHGFWHDAFAGTTADRVLRRAETPVLVVPDRPWGPAS